MFTSEATTQGIRVQVVSRYSPERSQPSGNKWFFLYTVTISNEGSETVQLLTRHWMITDGAGQIEDVSIPAVLTETVPDAAGIARYLDGEDQHPGPSAARGCGHLQNFT